MEKDEVIQLDRGLANTVVFANLDANEDFAKWRDEKILARMNQYSEAILNFDRSDPLWKEKVAEKIIAYQELKFTFIDSFSVGLSSYNGLMKIKQERLSEIKG